MATPTVEAVYTSHSSDGGNVGRAVTTDATPAADDYLLFCLGVNANADTLTPPAGGWTEISVSDNSIAVGGGQIRAWVLKDPADSTTYTWTVATSTRRTCIALLIRGADGTTFSNADESAQSAPGANHTPPAITTTADDCLIVDFAMLRQFAPDVADWAVPASGLTWTERADLQGADGNNNVRLAAGTAPAGAAGAVSTAAWTNSDTAEDSIIIRVAVQPAAGGGTDAEVEPTVIAVVVSMPAVAVSTGSTVAPATIAASTSMPAPTVATGSTVAPATIAATATLPVPGVATGSTAGVLTIAGVTTVPAVTVEAGGATVAPATIAASASMPAPTLATGSSVAPSTILCVATLPAPEVSVPGSGLTGNAHGRLALVPGATVVHTGSILGAIT